MSAISKTVRKVTSRDITVSLVRGPVAMATTFISNLATPSIAFAYLAGSARAHGYDCHIIDALALGPDSCCPADSYPGFFLQGLSIEETIERIPPDTSVIGFSIKFSAEWPFQRDFISAVRKRFPHALLVAGGEHITALTEFSLRDCPALDVCVRGEGEHTFAEVLEAHRLGKDIGATVGHIGYRAADGDIHSNDSLSRIREIDTIPWPHWPEGYLEAFWQSGQAFGVQSPRDIPMLATRGCPYQCTFCSSPQMWTTRYIMREPHDVVAEIKHYVERYDITAVQFYDLTALMKKQWTLEFCQKLLDEGIRLNWSLPSGTRSEVLDEEVLGMMQKTGCNFISYAPESGDETTLKAIKKRIDLDRMNESIMVAIRLGLKVRTNLVIGFPHETRRQILRTLCYGFTLSWRGVDDVLLSLFAPYPGSELFDDLVARQVISIDDDYFLSLNSRWGVNKLRINPQVTPWELAVYRLGGMLLNYIISYVRYPSRIWRTFRNLLFRDESSTNFEHFLKVSFQRWAPTMASKR